MHTEPRTHNARRSTRWLIGFLLVTALIAGCSASTDSSGPSGSTTRSGATGGSADEGDATAGLTKQERDHLVTEGSTTWDVTYTKDTTVVSGKALKTITKSDAKSGTFTFDRAGAKKAGLDLSKGRVLLVAGQALGRITGTTDSGSTTTVKTKQASLADAIQDGTVGWDVPITFDFDQFVTTGAGGDAGAKPKPSAYRGGTDGHTRPQLTAISMALPDGRVVPVRTTDDDGPSGSIKVKPGDKAVEWTYGAAGNKYQFRLTAKGEKVDLLVVVSREVKGEAKMAYRGEGSIGSFRSVASSEYAKGKLSGSDIKMDDLAADFKLSASVAGAGVSPVNLEVPVPMLTYTWFVGFIPVTLDLKAKIIGTVKVQANASATAESSFKYRGSAGFSYQGTKVSASGATDIDDMDPKPADSAAPMGLNVDAQFGVAFPTVSLSMLGQGIVPYLQVGAVIGSRLEWGGPAAGFPASSLCKSAYVRTEVSGGYDLTFLGTTLTGDKFVLHKDKKETKADSCPDDVGGDPG